MLTRIVTRQYHQGFIRKLFLLACLLAGALARPPRSDDHEHDDHDHHYHEHHHYQHGNVHNDDHADHGDHADPHDSDTHEGHHFLKVHSGNPSNGDYSGQGYHDSAGHYIKVYHTNEPKHHEPEPEPEPEHEEEEEEDDYYGYHRYHRYHDWDDCEWEGWSTDPDCDCSEDCDCADCGCDTEFNQSNHLDELDHLAGTIEDDLDNYPDGNEISAMFSGLIEDITALDSVGDSAGPDALCERDNGFQCGGSAPQCITRMMVCDGVNDCANHADEDQHHCHMAMPVGSHWRGEVVYDHCTKRKPKVLELTITSVETLPWFSLAPEVHAHVDVEKKLRDRDIFASFDIEGHWHSSERALYLEPPESDGLALTCEFHGHAEDMCIGHIKREISGQACAKFIFHRV